MTNKAQEYLQSKYNYYSLAEKDLRRFVSQALYSSLPILQSPRLLIRAEAFRLLEAVMVDDIRLERIQEYLEKYDREHDAIATAKEKDSSDCLYLIKMKALGTTIEILSEAEKLAQ